MFVPQSDNSAISYLIKSRDQHQKSGRSLMSTRCPTGRHVVSLIYIITHPLAFKEMKYNSLFLSISGVQIYDQILSERLGERTIRM